LAPHTHNVVASAPVYFLSRIYGAIPVLTLPSFNQQALIDTTPLPDDIPKVKELGASSAPLLSASFFIGARCKAYNDDYMMCKTEANGRGELECMKEGRKVTRCAASV
jgi:NADH dehydrogenase (ubiquinone) 1 alpha subcomplex subunit 8